MKDETLNLFILSPDEKIIGTLNPDIIDIEEINTFGGLRELKITHPQNDGGVYDYDELLKHGNKIWKNKTSDGNACLYVINTEKIKDLIDLTIPAEEVLVELNSCGVLESTTANPITVTSDLLENYFGKYYNIRDFETPIKSQTFTFNGTLTRLGVMRDIEESTGNIFVTSYEINPADNTIERYLDFKNDIGETHPIPLEMGENTDKIEITRDESDTYTAIVPIIKGKDGAAVNDTITTAQVMADFKALAVTKGQSIPMIIEKGENGTETIKAYWNAPFDKASGSYLVYQTEDSADYCYVYEKNGSANKIRKTGLFETTETNKYIIYNNMALKLMDKLEPVISIEADVNDLIDLPGGDLPYNIGDYVNIRFPGDLSVFTTRVIETVKNPREIGQGKIKLNNKLTRVTSGGSSEINRSGLDTPTLAALYNEITPNNLLNKIKGVDGAGSGLDTDLVRGYAMGGYTAAMNAFAIGTGSGYTRFYHANGSAVISMAWGRISITVTGTSSESASVTFPFTFQNTPNVIVTPAPGFNASASNMWVSAQSISSTGCTIFLGRSTTTATTIMWFAIGR